MPFCGWQLLSWRGLSVLGPATRLVRRTRKVGDEPHRQREDPTGCECHRRAELESLHVFSLVSPFINVGGHTQQPVLGSTDGPSNTRWSRRALCVCAIMAVWRAAQRGTLDGQAQFEGR